MFCEYRWTDYLESLLLVRLSRGPNVTMGGLEIFHNNSWLAVCDTGLSDLAARIACRTLNFKDGKAVPASGYGNITSDIGVSSITCGNLASTISDCKIEYSSNCSTGAYASAYCSNEPIEHTGKLALYELYIRHLIGLCFTSSGLILAAFGILLNPP